MQTKFMYSYTCTHTCTQASRQRARLKQADRQKLKSTGDKFVTLQSAAHRRTKRQCCFCLLCTHTYTRERAALSIWHTYSFFLDCDLLKWMQAQESRQTGGAGKAQQANNGAKGKRRWTKKKEFAQIAKLTGDGDVASGSGNESERALANLFTPHSPFSDTTTPVLYLSISLSVLASSVCCSVAP